MKDSPSSSQYRRSLQIVFIAAAALLILQPPSDLHAATETWDGGHSSNNYWYANLNWADGSAPVSGDDLVFAGTTRLNHYSYANSNPFSISSITFDATAGAFVINNGGGGTYRLTGNITNNSTNLQTIKFPFTLFGSTTVWATAGDIKLEGVISGGNALTKNGSSTLTLTGSNTFSGGSYLDSGTTTVTTNTALGTGQIHIVRGVATLDLGANGLTISNNIFYGNWGAGYKTVQLDLPGTNTGTLSGQLDMRLSTSGDIRFNVGADDTLTLSGKLHLGAGGGAGLTKEGAGTLIVSSSSVPSYTGINRIEAGTLQVGTGGTGGYLNTASITNNGTLVYNRSDAITISNVISGTGNLTQNGSGTTTLSGANTYTGATTVNAGTLAINNNMTIGAITGSGDLSLGSGYTLTTSSSSSTTYSGVISGSGALTKSGSGSLTLSGSNSYTGGTTHTNSNLEMGADGALGNGTFTFNPTATSRLRLNGTNQTITGLTILGASASVIENQGGGSGVLTIQIASGETSSSTGTLYFRDHNVGSGTLALVKTGDGTLDFSTYNTMNYTGGLTVNGGTMSYNNVDALGGGTITLGGGTLNYTGSGSATIARNTTLSVGTTSSLNNAAGSVALSGVVSGSGALTKTGAGTLTLSNSNTYSGGTTLNSGTLVIGNTAAAGTGTITQADGTSVLKLDITGTIANAMSIYNVSSNKTVTLTGAITAQNTTYDVASGTTLSLNGTISSSGGITKNGTGTLEVNGASNTYTGDTVVNAGTLEANASGALGASGNITVHNGGSLLVQASNAIGNSSNVNLNGGTWGFNGDISDTVGALTLSANSTIDMKDGNISLIFSGLASALTNTTRLNVYNYTLYSDHIYFTSNANLSSSLPYISFYSGFGTGFIGSSFVEGLSSPWQVRPVPEPETWATAALLLIGGGIWMWRKRRAGERRGEA